MGILASGQSSTMTGTYAGQFAMEVMGGLWWGEVGEGRGEGKKIEMCGEKMGRFEDLKRNLQTLITCTSENLTI